MIAYLEKYDTTVDVPDDISQGDLKDVNENFHSYVDKPATTPATTPADQPVAAAPEADASSTPQAASGAVPQKWQPNFYEAVLKPALIRATLPITKLAELPQSPEVQAFGGKALGELSFGLAKPLMALDPTLMQQEKEHPAFAEAGSIVGGVGSLFVAGGALRVAGLGAEAGMAGKAAVEAGFAAGERFIPRAIMTGATFGTRTFIAETVKAFQDGGVNLEQFGKDVLKDTAFGAIFGTIGGLSKPIASISSAAGLGFISSKMSGADNREASLNAAIWAAFETVGSVGKTSALRLEALGNLKDSIGEYVEARNPGVNEKDAARAASQFVDHAITKAGFENAEDIAKSGPENLLEGIEKVNQIVRTAHVPATETGTPALPKLPGPIAPEPAAGAEPVAPVAPTPQTPIEKMVEQIKEQMVVPAEPAAAAIPEGPRTYDERIADLKAQGHDISKIPPEAFPTDLKDIYHYEQARGQKAEMEKGLGEIAERFQVLGIKPNEGAAIFNAYGLDKKGQLGQPVPALMTDLVNTPIHEQYKTAYKALADQRGIDKGDKYDAVTMDHAEKAVDLINGYFNQKSQQVFDFAKEHPEVSDHDVAQMAHDRGLLEEPNNDLLKLEIQKAKQEKILGMIQPSQASPSTAKTPQGQQGTGSESEALERKIFPGPKDLASNQSLTGKPEYIKMRKMATEIVTRYAKEQGVTPTEDFSHSLHAEMHDQINRPRLAGTPEKQMAAFKDVMAKYPNIEKDYPILADQIKSDGYEWSGWFEKHVKQTYPVKSEQTTEPMQVVKPNAQALNAKGKPFALFVGNQEGVGAMYNVYGEHPTLSTGRYMHSTVSGETIAKEGIPITGREARVPEGTVPATPASPTKPTASPMMAPNAAPPRAPAIPKIPMPEAAVQAAYKLKESADEITNLVNPANAAPLAAQITREQLGKMARSYDMVEAALEQAKDLFDKQPKEANLAFIDRIEHGVEETDPKLAPIAATLRKLLDEKRAEIQALGTGKLKAFIENYFPHIWDQGEKEVGQVVQKAAKRPFEGQKGFLKKRSIEFTKDGVEMGLTPVSFNPVDLTLLKLREMDKYLMAHRTIDFEFKKEGLSKVVNVGQDPPEGWIKIDDRMSTIFKSPMVAVQEAFDAKMMADMNDVAKGLGIDLERGMRQKGEGQKLKDAWGVSYSTTPGTAGRIWTKFAGPESALAHELGHQIDNIYGLQAKLLSNPKIDKELTKLANERAPENAKPAFKKYIQEPGEKMAAMMEAYIHAPELLKETAPETYKTLEKFLKSDPKLALLTDVKPSLQMGVNKSEVYAGGNVIAGHIYAQPDAARIINNYLSPGLQKSAIFQAFRYAGNLINQFQLGFSAFHLGFTTLDTAISKFALGLNELALGHPMKAIRNVLEVPIAPITNVIRGNDLLKAWRGQGQNVSDDVMAEAMASGGGRARMDQFYATRAYEQMKHHFQAGNIVRGVLHIPLSIVEASSKPILEYIVPRQKLGVFADIMKMEMENNPNMTHQEMRVIAQKAWNSVDNRMGQMVYDNLFWNRTFKDLLMSTQRSVGWNLGTARELGGGAADYVEQIIKGVKGKRPELTYKMAYSAALPMLIGMIGAITTYLFTGKGPQELKDYYFPKTGGVDANGNPKRVSFPSYMKDLYHWSQNPAKVAVDKLHPIFSIIADMLQNKDYYGTKIRNEDDPLVKQTTSEIAFMLKQIQPFSYRNMQKNLETHNKSLFDTVGPWVGITPAPYDINQTKAERIAHEIAASHQEIGGRTQEQAERSKLLSDLTRQYRMGDPKATDNLYQAYQEGHISHRQMQNVIIHSTMTPLQRMVNGFTLQETNRVYDKASDEEKAQIERIRMRKEATQESEFVAP